MIDRDAKPKTTVGRWKSGGQRFEAKELAAIKREQPGWRNGAKVRVVQRGAASAGARQS